MAAAGDGGGWRWRRPMRAAAMTAAAMTAESMRARASGARVERVNRGETRQRLVHRTTAASALHLQLWCDTEHATAAAVAQMLICSCTACDHARRRAVIIRCTRGLVDDGISLSCVAHSTPLASSEWERDGGAEAAVRTESEAAHWLPCAPGFHALAALALHRGRLFTRCRKLLPW